MYGNPGSGYQGYPGGAAPGYGQGAATPDVQQWFNTVDKDRSGQINWQELQSALINGQGKNFSDVACKLMIGMFDRDKTGTIDINEFQQLFAYINQWLAVFKNYDRDQSGHIEEPELAQALQQMGFKFSPDFVKFLIAKSDLQNHKQMSVDQFIVLCVQIQRFTEAFRSRDSEMKGVITIGFEDFLSVAINCST
ncbi:peflin [Tribolium castaneum]|uniref:Calpain-B-like Protein n=1 Tax=Tribolium castaneum TaxID=7070 RepID=D6W7C1_TRICA|nr:PREDICTED: peflin [Tribolium castaneum]EFA11122.1 Calpain-B-like Protein [Tribolium castaneum]|eukprot:XP_008200590.1 PREDICTED: peflin [Tribolium castaneum]